MPHELRDVHWLLHFTFLLTYFFLFCNATQNTTSIGCFELRDVCLQSAACKFRLENLGQTCGDGRSACYANKSQDCLESLSAIRELLGEKSNCACNNLTTFDECVSFKSSVWLNPCETAFVEDVRPAIQRVVRSPSPNAERIQRWRQELSQELSPKIGRSATTSCDSSLNLCLKHISCRELWKIFRQTCAVDEQNVCHMTNRNDCWQAYEGLTWTGLGSCTCGTNHSDCHWIRLQTNYNKCIYEITSSGNIPSTVSVRLPLVSPPTTPLVPFWAASTAPPSSREQPQYPPTYPQNNHQQSVYSYQTNWWTTQPPAPQMTSEQYQREFARRENERRLQEQRLREAEEQRRRWRGQQEASRPTAPALVFATSPPLAANPPSSSPSYIRGTYQSTRSTPAHWNTSRAYRLNGAYYRSHKDEYQTATVSPLPTSSSTTPPPTTSSTTTTTTTTEEPTTTPASTTTTTSEPPTTSASTTPAEATNESGGKSRSHVPFQHIANNRNKETTTTTEVPSTVEEEEAEEASTETTASSEPSQELTTTLETTKDELEIADDYTNRDEQKIVSLESKEGGDRKEEVEDGVLVARWEIPTNRSEGAKSTCGRAFELCENDETCRWHNSELAMRCKQQSGDVCERSQCAAAMRRFSRYVKKNILEAMMFCQCSFSDVTCKHQQQWIYPRCLYDSFHKKPRHSCTETVQSCQSDSYCLRTLNAFNRSCPLNTGPAGGCVARDLHQCRLALIGVRGTHLESPCYCEKDDERCLEHQNMVLPNNPCVEDAMVDYVNGGSGEDEEENEIQPPPPKNYRRGQKKPKVNESKRTTTTTTAEPPASVESEASPTSAENSTESAEEAGGESAAKNDNANELPTPVPIVKTEAPSKGTKITKKPGTATAARVVNAPQLVTQTPPPKDGGCFTRNLEGGWITHYKNSIFRMYSDLAGRCSEWCTCSKNETFTCENLGCLPEGSCETPQTTVEFGHRLIVEGRGTCLCVSGEFICDTSEEEIQLDPGIYVGLGFSRTELKMIREKVPKASLEKSGLVSPSASVANDIASRLQFALERVLTKDTLCRVALMERYTHDSFILLQIQWYGADPASNKSEKHWHVGKLEKHCAPFVRQLEYNFQLEKADRYQLVLSTVKQLRVFDLLDGLPIASGGRSSFRPPFFLSVIPSTTSSSLLLSECLSLLAVWIFVVRLL